MRAGYIFRFFAPWHAAADFGHAVPLLALFAFFSSHISSSIKPTQNRAATTSSSPRFDGGAWALLVRFLELFESVSRLRKAAF